ncbi:MAG: M48 family metallopeptidase [Minisyncoccia bacterium]
MANLYQYKDSNIRKTYFLFTVFLVFIIGLGWFFSYLLHEQIILFIAVIFSIITSLVSYYYSDKLALSLSRAQPADKNDYLELYRLIENLCITAGLPMPKIYIVPEMQINAFATGRDANNAVIAVTQGALTKLNKTELEGVLAHELSHIGNRDILVSTIVVILAGIISMVSDIFLRSVFWFGGGSDDRENNNGIFLLIGIVLSILAPLGAMLIQLAISRKRESLADTSGVLLTRYPNGLINALEKIAADTTAMKFVNTSTAHLWISDPYKNSKKTPWYHKIFMTHPPIEERIAALKNLNI